MNNIIQTSLRKLILLIFMTSCIGFVAPVFADEMVKVNITFKNPDNLTNVDSAGDPESIQLIIPGLCFNKDCSYTLDTEKPLFGEGVVLKPSQLNTQITESIPKPVAWVKKSDDGFLALRILGQEYDESCVLKSPEIGKQAYNFTATVVKKPLPFGKEDWEIGLKCKVNMPE